MSLICRNCTAPMSPRFSKGYAGMCETCATILEGRDKTDARDRAKLEAISSVFGALIWSGLGCLVCWQLINGGQIMLPRILALPVVALNALAGVTGVALTFVCIAIAILMYGAYAYRRMIRLS